MGILDALRSIPSKRPEVVCPMCQVKGQVSVSQLQRKRGISGGKAVGALLTGGLSLFAVGLSRKELISHAYCNNCKSEWDF